MDSISKIFSWGDIANSVITIANIHKYTHFIKYQLCCMVNTYSGCCGLELLSALLLMRPCGKPDTVIVGVSSGWMDAIMVI